MRSLVIDASVAIKWVVEEPGTEQAIELLTFRLSAPDLLVAEYANILWKKVVRRELSAEEASLAGRLLERADVDLVPMRRLLGRAVDLSIALGHPAYDCVYLALAETTGRAFVTADQRICRKVREHSLAVRVFELSGAGASLRAQQG